MRPLVIAHRGASGERRENSLAAFARAIEAGADFVELDVHPWGERELLVSHDPPRGRGRLASLAEVLALCGRQIGVMVELKTPYRYRGSDFVARVLELLDDEAVVVCFEPGAIAAVRRRRPRLRTMQHLASVPLAVAAAAGCWAVGLEQRRAGAAPVRRAQALGLKVAVYTVNEPARMLELCELGVEAIFTDDPRAAVALFGRRPGA
jgi:glycerophosphoryl diester phosphodiesterase